MRKSLVSQLGRSWSKQSTALQVGQTQLLQGTQPAGTRQEVCQVAVVNNNNCNQMIFMTIITPQVCSTIGNCCGSCSPIHFVLCFYSLCICNIFTLWSSDIQANTNIAVMWLFSEWTDQSRQNQTTFRAFILYACLPCTAFLNTRASTCRFSESGVRYSTLLSHVALRDWIEQRSIF